MSDSLYAALSSIPAEDRDLWVRMGMAVKSELGEAGFDLWDQWSRSSARYRERDARSVWRSIRPYGGVTVTALYAEARRHGWRGEAAVRSQVAAAEQQRKRMAARQRARDKERAETAARKAQAMIDQAEFTTHPYLTAKGFPEVQGLVINNDVLLVPMRDVATGALLNVQQIWPGGAKKFLAGGRARGAVHRLGRATVRWYCEGFATALSIKAALARLYRRDQIVVCFSAHNLARMARRGGYVVADHDASAAGEKAARESGQRWWMPPEPGDANDLHQTHGIAGLVKGLRKVLHGD